MFRIHTKKCIQIQCTIHIWCVHVHCAYTRIVIFISFCKCVCVCVCVCGIKPLKPVQLFRWRPTTYSKNDGYVSIVDDPLFIFHLFYENDVFKFSMSLQNLSLQINYRLRAHWNLRTALIHTELYRANREKNSIKVSIWYA